MNNKENTMNVRIIVDSTADLLPQIRQRLTVVPLTVRFGDEEYIDGVTITQREFYEKLIESDVMPTTSQASPYVFEEAFREAVSASSMAGRAGASAACSSPGSGAPKGVSPQSAG